jgi:hypothetical protein
MCIRFDHPTKKYELVRGSPWKGSHDRSWNFHGSPWGAHRRGEDGEGEEGDGAQLGGEAGEGPMGRGRAAGGGCTMGLGLAAPLFAPTAYVLCCS